MKIRDTNKTSKKPPNDGVLTFRFFTIENVDVVDDVTSSSAATTTCVFDQPRANRADDNELVLLEVAEFLKAK